MVYLRKIECLHHPSCSVGKFFYPLRRSDQMRKDREYDPWQRIVLSYVIDSITEKEVEDVMRITLLIDCLNYAFVVFVYLP